MRSFMFVSLILVLMMGIVMAGGIVTNTNQSAAYMRTLNRNASTDIDAVYFNPAGLTKLEDGLHLSLSNQSIWQTKTVTNSYTYLNSAEYVGDVAAPIFPNFYLAYKTGKLAVSAGFEPIGGGGSANYEKGVPSFEMPVSDLVPGLAAQGQPISAYDIDVAFEGSSIYYGAQANVSYKINDMISVGVGARYVAASNSYVGHLKDIAITLGGSAVPAPTFFSGAAAQYTSAATGATSAVTGLSGAITAGQVTGSTPLATMDADSSLINGLIAFGIDPTGYTVDNAIAAYTGAATSAATSAAQMTAKATLLSDQEVDATQTASGITPIISIFLTPMEG
ncbi:aromatic hydrocarbon degradation protein, partial [bacterium]|nr:aromatic hydrocarbon degradation protein [bacterium]